MSDTHKKHSEENWEKGELGATESFVRKASSNRDKKVDEGLELQAISIRLQKSLIDDLRELAGEDGLGYQPYLRRVLTQHVRSEKRKRGKHLRIIAR